MERVREAFRDLLPAMVADGGGANIVSLVDGVLTIRLRGTCIYCPSRELTADALAQEITTRVPSVRQVIIEYPPLGGPQGARPPSGEFTPLK